MAVSSTLRKIADIVVDVARHEDLILRRVGQGIFLVPELAFVYAVGRTIAANASAIFGTPNVRWLPETKAGNTGRTDLIFAVEGQTTYALEFKRAGKGSDYASDLRKLAAMDSSWERIFCALIDTWPHEIDPNPRIVEVESCENVVVERLTERFDFFATLDSRYANQVCCVVGLWRIGSSA